MSVLEFIWAKQRTLLEARSQQTEKTASQNENLQFVEHLELGRELKEDWIKVGKSKARIGLDRPGCPVAQDGYECGPTENQKFT